MEIGRRSRTVWLGIVLGTWAVAGVADPPTVPLEGCPCAHCDTRMSDLVRMPALFNPEFAWEDRTVIGSNIGLGCSSDGRFVACSFWNSDPALAAYDANGVSLWDSGTHLDDSCWTSAPLILSDGTTIAADRAKVACFGQDGTVLWSTSNPGGTPISPLVTDHGFVVLATKSGPISTYSALDGTLKDTLTLTGEVDGNTEIFSTVNTPSVQGSRFMVLTENDTTEGRLYSIEVDDGGMMTVAWHFKYRSPSGGSPVSIDDVVYFDGDGLNPSTTRAPQVIAVRDLGSQPSLVWTRRIPKGMQASMARDPRGGLWGWVVGDPLLRRFSESTGDVTEWVDVDTLVDEEGEHRPGSPMSVANGTVGPVLVFVAKATGYANYLVAVEMGATATLRWKYALTSVQDAWGQFPVLEAPDGDLVMVFSTHSGGVLALRSGPPETGPAGSVPDGADVSGTPLTVSLEPGGDLTLAWGEGCLDGDTDYEIYEGTIGEYPSHASLFCSTGGGTTMTFPPSSGDRYYLVVRSNLRREGSYGTDSSGNERPRGVSPCLVRETFFCD